ncbi:MAG: LysR family transcriptional regulator [Chloroflexaceae bacterium]|nr:LysR family transcriptional regulator [Chloroflexaceae bacterium]
MLNTIHLRTFLAVVEAGNYTAAAEQLHMSQPAVSMHVRALEEQLGDIRLFRRVGQRMIPTHAGEVLLAAARELVTLSERAEQDIQALKGHITGRVVIGCTSNSGEHLLPPLIARFLARFPDVTMEIRVAPGEVLLDALATQHLSLLFFEEHQRRRGWESCCLGREPLVLLAPPDHSILQQSEVTPGMLRDYPLVVPCSESPLRRIIEDGLRRRGVAANDLTIALETTSIAAMLQSVHEGVGLAFVPRTRIPQKNGLAPVEFTGAALYQEWYTIRLRSRRVPQAAQELYTFLTGALAQGTLTRAGLEIRQD